ncbi:MAG: hypothetical protein V3R99_07500 [Thermoguttaceae bacterium]
MSDFSPLFAFDIGEWVPVVIFIVIAVISVLGKILNKAGQKQQPGGGGPRPARQAPRRQGQKPAGEQLVDEIGDFLRKAAKQGRGQQGQAGPQARQPRPKPVRAEAVRAAPVEAQAVGEVPTGSGVERHVREHLEKEKLTRRSSRLGSEVSQADEKIDQRLHEVFDHDVSELAKRSKKTAELPSTAAAGLTALFSNAESIRQAIIINEVLTRPVDRWA